MDLRLRDARDEALALDIVRELGATPGETYEIVGRGTVNHVFVTETTDGPWVVRFHRDPLDSDDYSKEAWCLSTMSGLGVSVPELIGIGSCNGVRFIVQRFVSGENADDHRSPGLWRALGRYARIINESPLNDAPETLFPRFGRDLVGNWHAHVDYNLEQLSAQDPLLELQAYELRHQQHLKTVFHGLRSKVDRFGLTHGDLVPKNVLLPTDGAVVVIDWGSASTGAVPFLDCNRIRQDLANEGFAQADLRAFADGYGIPVEALHDAMEDLTLLDHIDVVRWAIDRRPDRIVHYAKRAQALVTRRFG